MVSNAVKHSGCTELKISLSVKENNLELVVSDNGNGFDPQKSFEGNGVKNIQSRASSLKGEVKLTTSHGNGTKWEFALPL